MMQTQSLQKGESSGPDEKMRAWLARAGSDVRELDHHNENQTGYNEAFSWLNPPQINDEEATDDRERVEDDRQLIASAPKKARRLALSPQEMQALTGTGTCSTLSAERSLWNPTSRFCERKSPIPGLLPDSVLDQWEQRMVFPKQKRSGKIKRSFSRSPRFLLVVDPPEGEELAAWRPLKRNRMLEQIFLRSQFLLPPPRQNNKKGRKREQERKD